MASERNGIQIQQENMLRVSFEWHQLFTVIQQLLSSGAFGQVETSADLNHYHQYIHSILDILLAQFERDQPENVEQFVEWTKESNKYWDQVVAEVAAIGPEGGSETIN